MTDAQVVFDPETYVTGVPFDTLAKLRRAAAVTWVDETPVLGWPGGPGFWLVLRHADVAAVLAQPSRFSSARGATQIRDPAPASRVYEDASCALSAATSRQVDDGRAAALPPNSHFAAQVVAICPDMSWLAEPFRRQSG